MYKSVSFMLAALALIAPAANAVTLAVVPAAPAANVGSTFSVDVVASGVGTGAPSIGAYDVDLSYDSSLLSFNNLTLGTGLDVRGLGSLPGSDASVPGKVNVFEVSFDTIPDLNQLQPDTFTLFTLTFNAAAAGTSALQLTLNALSDAAGSALAASLQSGSVTVSPVPLPPTVWLLLSGLAGLVVTRTRRPADRLSIPGWAA